MPDQVVRAFADQWPFWCRLPGHRIVQVFHLGFSMNVSCGFGSRNPFSVKSCSCSVGGGVGVPMQFDSGMLSCFREVVVLIFGVADQRVDSFCRGFLVVPGCHPDWKWICFHRFVLVSVQVGEDRDSVKICFGVGRKTSWCVRIYVDVMWKIEMSILKPAPKEELEFLDDMHDSEEVVCPINKEDNDSNLGLV